MTDSLFLMVIVVCYLLVPNNLIVCDDPATEQIIKDKQKQY